MPVPSQNGIDNNEPAAVPSTIVEPVKEIISLKGEEQWMMIQVQVTTQNQKVRIVGKDYNQLNKNNCLLSIDGSEPFPFTEKEITIKETGTHIVKYYIKENLLLLNSFFTECNTMIEFDAGTLVVKDISSLNGFFGTCSALKRIKGVEKWDLSRTTDIGGMFYHCNALIDIKGLEKWNVENVTDMHALFFSCYALKDFSPLKNWNTKKLETLQWTFLGCFELEDLSFLANWDTSNCTNMTGLFVSCKNLVEVIPIKNWNTKKLRDRDELMNNGTKVKSKKNYSKDLWFYNDLPDDK